MNVNLLKAPLILLSIVYLNRINEIFTNIVFLKRCISITICCLACFAPYLLAQSHDELRTLVQKRLFLERKISQSTEDNAASEAAEQLHLMKTLMEKHSKQLLIRKINYIEKKLNNVRTLATIKKKVESIYKELCHENENSNKCKMRAKNLAIREAIEKGSAVRVESQSEIQDFELVKDIIKSNVEADMIIDNIEYILDSDLNQTKQWIVSIKATIVTEPDKNFINKAKSTLGRNFDSIIYQFEMEALQQFLSGSINFEEVLIRDLQEIKKRRKAVFIGSF